MSVPVIAFFNNKSGVGKSSLVCHVAHMYAELGLQVLAADLDPQCSLTVSILDDEAVESLFEPQQPPTIYQSIRPVLAGTGDVADPRVTSINSRLALIPGDMALSSIEDSLAENWPKCLDRDERAFRVTSAFWRSIQRGAHASGAAAALVDLGPNLGAINRAALIAADFVVIPLGPDLFSLHGLRNLGPTLIAWRNDWQERVLRNPVKDLPLPSGNMRPVGYVVIQHSIRLDRPVQAFDRWMAKIPGQYRESVLNEQAGEPLALESDPHCIAKLRDYRSLMPLAQDAHKPMFFLRAADGALGAHASAVQSAYTDFRRLAQEIAVRTGLTIPSP